jgi:hypothetical protein
MENNINEAVVKMVETIRGNLIGKIVTVWWMDSEILGFLQVSEVAAQSNSFFYDNIKDAIANGNYTHMFSIFGEGVENNGESYGIETEFEFVERNVVKKLNDMEWDDIADIELRIASVELRPLTAVEEKELELYWE